MKITIRPANKADFPEVLNLIKELAVFEKEPDAVEITVKDLEKEGLGENSLFQCLVAENENEILGMALFYFRFSTWKGRSLHLEDLIVREKHRGKGIGEALYKKVMEFAVEHNVKRVAWEVLDWNIDAINFYKRTGATILDEWRVVHFRENELNDYLKQ